MGEIIMLFTARTCLFSRNRYKNNQVQNSLPGITRMFTSDKP